MNLFRLFVFCAALASGSYAAVSSAAGSAPQTSDEEDRITLGPQVASHDAQDASYSLADSIRITAQGAIKAAGLALDPREAAKAAGASLYYRIYSQAQSRLVVISLPASPATGREGCLSATVFAAGKGVATQTVEWDAAASGRFLATVVRAEIFALTNEPNTVVEEADAWRRTTSEKCTFFFAERVTHGCTAIVARDAGLSLGAAEVERVLAELLPKMM